MKLIGYGFNNNFFRNKESLDKALTEYADNYEVDYKDLIIKASITIYEIYEYENGLTADELEYQIGIELPSNKKYIFIPRIIKINVEDKLEEEFKGYRYYKYLTENGELIKTYQIFDGYAFEIDLDNDRVLIGCDAFGEYKYKILDKNSDEYKKLNR